MAPRPTGRKQFLRPRRTPRPHPGLSSRCRHRSGRRTIDRRVGGCWRNHGSAALPPATSNGRCWKPSDSSTRRQRLLSTTIPCTRPSARSAVPWPTCKPITAPSSSGSHNAPLPPGPNVRQHQRSGLRISRRSEVQQRRLVRHASQPGQPTNGRAGRQQVHLQSPTIGQPRGRDQESMSWVDDVLVGES